MRPICNLWIVLMWCGLTFAQDSWTPPGNYAQPSAPRLATPVASPEALPTPFLTLDTPPLAVGASNATLENATGSAVHFNQPLWYEPGAPYNPPPQGSLASAAASAGASPVQTAAAFSVERHGIELGAATFQMDYGVAQLAGIRPRGKTSRVYTNPDVAAVNNANGTIKFRGKLEHVN